MDFGAGRIRQNQLGDMLRMRCGIRHDDESAEGVADEAPQHEVSVPSFALGKYDVTRAEYASFVRETGHSAGDGCGIDGFKWKKLAEKSWQNPGYKQTDRDPVVCISWQDAKAYIAWLNAKLVNGIEYFLELTGFEASVQKADVVITGEGSIDEQTLQGKGPFGVAAMAKKYHLPVIGVAGKVPLQNSPELNQYFDALFAIGNEPADLPSALKSTEENLVRTGIAIGNMLAI